MRTIGRIRRKGKRLVLHPAAAMPDALPPVNGRVELIQALIPLGLAAVAGAEEHQVRLMQRPGKSSYVD